MKKIVINQIITVVGVLIAFLLISKFTDKLESFAFGLIFYWTLLVGQLMIINKTKKLNVIMREMFSKSINMKISLLSFIPSVLVFMVAFLPLIHAINIQILSTTIIIGVINGFIEECYWRGSIYKESSVLLLIGSTLLFAVNHSAFLFFNISYEGGAINLIGGPLIMGMIWIFVAKKTKTIKFGVFAHQIVNALAFYSMFIGNM